MTVRAEHKISYVSFIEVATFSQNLKHLWVSHERVGEQCNGLPIVDGTTSDSLVSNLQHQHVRLWGTFNTGMRAIISIKVPYVQFFNPLLTKIFGSPFEKLKLSSNITISTFASHPDR